MDENDRAFIYNTRYELVEEEAFLSENKESPYTEIRTSIDEDIFLSVYSFYRKKRILPILLFLAIGIAIILFDMLMLDSFDDENTFYKIVIIATVPLGIACLLCIKSYLKSPMFLRYLRNKYDEHYNRICEIVLYDSYFTYHDRLKTWPFMIKGIEVIPYSAIVKLVNSEECIALVDKTDRGYFFMYKNCPAGLYEWLLSKCTRAKHIDMK
ncbi:MAG: hypothetical protein IJ740_01675 [Ruminococcus sp.]|nr:hypothetical protein [Ruminococcus sp.]